MCRLTIAHETFIAPDKPLYRLALKVANKGTQKWAGLMDKDDQGKWDLLCPRILSVFAECTHLRASRQADGHSSQHGDKQTGWVACCTFIYIYKYM